MQTHYEPLVASPAMNRYDLSDFALDLMDKADSHTPLHL